MFHRRLVAFVCALVIVAGIVASATSTALGASTGTIAGTVRDAKTNAPIANATVTATAPSGKYEAKTNAKGEFTIVGVVLDTYSVAITAPTYHEIRYDGTTVTADETVRIDAKISTALASIGLTRTTARAVTSAFQPSQTVDRYTIDASGIAELLGKTFDTDQSKLLSRLPSVTIDRSGTPLIRGGYSFQTAFQYEGIDYTEPNTSALNRFQNFGNANLLNGVGSLEIIPGGGDATHGDTGTGLIALTAKRGTYPGFANVDIEGALRPDFHQFGFEDAIASPDKRLSNYFSYINAYQQFQYGPYGVPANTIGASAITPDPFLNSNVNAHYGVPWTSAYFNASNISSADFVDNLVYKFGRDQQQSLQFFAQSQAIREQLNYGGINGLSTPSLTGPGSIASAVAGVYSNNTSGVMNADEQATLQTISPRGPFPFGTPLGSNDTVYSPFSAYKLEYTNIFNASTVGSVRFYRTDSNQSLTQAEQGLYSPDNGGTRSGVMTDLTKVLGQNSLQLGGKFEFARPFGTTLDSLDYNSAYGPETGGLVFPYRTTGNVVRDFIPVSPVGTDPVTGNPNGTAGCYGVVGANGQPNLTAAPCGYLAQFFPGGIPPLPAEQEVPTAQEQIYGLYLQDTWSPSARFKALIGMRLDGYNFLLPSDPTDPPAVDGIRHQRLYEPHLGLSERFTDRDAVRVNFGRTMSIPLPTFLGLNIDRSSFDAFNRIPSYDNTKGPYDASRPQGTEATWCGPGTIQTSSIGTVISGNQPCTSYADQLYWLMRNYRYGLQGQIDYPLRAATFTNYDASFSHEFKGGASIRITPFYRRGYDVVETTRTLIGYDPVTDIPQLSPSIYSNLGFQSATGVELDVVSPQRPTGFSYQLTGTYINQFGNDPPGLYLPTESVQLGEVYHSPNLSPFQSTLGVTYRTASGWRITPDLHYVRGYPYGAGVLQAITINGQPVYVPLTDYVVTGAQSATVASAWVDPQNPGTIAHPVIDATRGTEAANSGPGTLLSKASVTSDVTVEFHPPSSKITYGLGITNLFNQTADIPVVNYTYSLLPVMTGRFTAMNPTGTTATNGYPTAVGSSTSPYIVFPNQPPLTVRLYMQFAL